MKKKILIIGNSPKEYALAKKLSEFHDIYITPATDTLKEFATCLDIREDSIKELLEFVVENDIDMTVAISQKAIEADIATLFNNNKQPIFAPTASASEVVYNKVLSKKILYKLHIPTPKFGIFEKQNLVLDYVKNQKIPFVIKNNDANSAVVVTSMNIAKKITDAFFLEKNKKIIIEDYVYGTPFSFYALTDGYKAIPIGSSVAYKYSLDGGGGQLTSGMAACSPNYKLSLSNEYFLMDRVIYPMLEYSQNMGHPYLGIIGVNGILTEEGNLYILGWQSFMQDCDSAAVLKNVEEDLVPLFEACIIGSFSDEVDRICLNNNQSTSLTLCCKNKINNENVISGLENLDENTVITYFPNVCKNKYNELEAVEGPVMIITACASSFSKSTEKIYEEAKEINFAGMYYRNDICTVKLR